MDTLRKGSFKGKPSIVISGIFLLIAAGISRSDTQSSIQILSKTYNHSGTITKSDMETEIENLNRALRECNNDYVAFRIKYRIGVIYFKSGTLEKSRSYFLKLAAESNSPDIIRLCSLNMIGQISRLQGHNKDALEAFGQVINLVEKRKITESEVSESSVWNELFGAALLSRAEIYELIKKYSASIKEYNHICSAYKQDVNKKELLKYIPLALDRISQLYIRQGDIDGYIKAAEELISDYPNYYRASIIKLEKECVIVLRSLKPDIQFTYGSISAPPELIKRLKEKRAKSQIQSVSQKISDLCEVPQNTFTSIILQYYNAWFLDSLGEKDKAIDILAHTVSQDSDFSNDEKQLYNKTIEQYARIQHAIILSEKASYVEALKVLNELAGNEVNSHISNLATCVANGITTLKREAPRYERSEM